MNLYEKKISVYIFDIEKEKEARNFKSILQEKYKYVNIYPSIAEIRVEASNQE